MHLRSLFIVVSFVVMHNHNPGLTTHLTVCHAFVAFVMQHAFVVHLVMHHACLSCVCRVRQTHAMVMRLCSSVCDVCVCVKVSLKSKNTTVFHFAIKHCLCIRRVPRVHKESA